MLIRISESNAQKLIEALNVSVRCDISTSGESPVAIQERHAYCDELIKTIEATLLI